MKPNARQGACVSSLTIRQHKLDNMKILRRNNILLKKGELFSKPIFPDERISDKDNYNTIVAKQIKSLGFTVIQEMPMPLWGVADIIAYNNIKSIVIECKSEKDTSYMRAVGQIITYSFQLLDYGFKVDEAIIITRKMPLIGKKGSVRNQIRLLDDIKHLDYYLPFKVKYIQVSNKKPLISI